MRLCCLTALLGLATACEPPPPATVRVINATAHVRALDVTWQGEVAFQRVLHGEASAFRPLPVGRGEARATDSFSLDQLGQATLEVPPDTRLSLVLAPDTTSGLLKMHPLIESTSEPPEGFVRLRLLHAAEAPGVSVDLGADGAFEVLSVAPGSDSGFTGFDAPANRPSPLELVTGGQRVRFTVPALPSRGSLLLVLTNTQNGGLTLLGVARSAALGFIEPETP